MTTTITIRNVPEDVRDELVARAARQGRSLQEFMLGEIIRLAEKPRFPTSSQRWLPVRPATHTTSDAKRSWPTGTPTGAEPKRQVDASAVVATLIDFCPD